jgi:uncharacterized protein (TIGR02145 family)/uncharacterized repeat protein (TIGR02543 family)
VSFSVTLSGTQTVTYQWKNDAGNLTEGHYVGTKTAALTINSIVAGDASTYSCVVTNAGGSVATSTGAKLTVNTLSSTPTLAANITSICPPGTVIFTITGTLGTGANWQVYAGGIKLTTQPTITSNSFTISSINAATSYSVKAEGGTCDNSSSPPTSNSVAIALTSYKVTFNANGGNPVPSIQPITCNNTATTPTQSPSKTGYNFAGWYIDTSYTSAFNFITPITAAISLNAKWAIKQYTLAFNIAADVPGVTGQIIASPTKALYDSNSAVTLTAPTDNNYTFTGWTGSNTGSTNQFSIVMNGNKTLTANYTIKKYTLTITTTPATGGGSITPASGLSYNSGTTVPLTASPNSGYNFINWTITSGTATIANATNATTATVMLSSGNATVTANFGLNAPTITTDPSNKNVTLGGTVTFNVTASGSSLSYQWQKNGSNIASATTASYTIPPATVSDNNSTYQCVVTNGGGSVTSNAATLTVQCLVTFDGQGGTVSSGPKNVTVGLSVGTLPTVSGLSGCNFYGWGTGTNYSGSTFNSNTVANANITVYAQWTMSDAEGHAYKVAKIGDQFWMAENLKATKYNDGISQIPLVADGTAWSNLTTPGYCWYIIGDDTYGALYNWYTVDPANSNKIAPTGWHVSNETDWNNLQTFLIANGYNWDNTTTGNKIAKSMAAKTLWLSSTTDGAIGNDLTTNNRSGFSALPAGFRDNYGQFTFLGQGGCWWSTMEADALRGMYYSIGNNNDYLDNYEHYKGFGKSVRLVRD